MHMYFFEKFKTKQWQPKFTILHFWGQQQFFERLVRFQAILGTKNCFVFCGALFGTNKIFCAHKNSFKKIKIGTLKILKIPEGVFFHNNKKL